MENSTNTALNFDDETKVYIVMSLLLVLFVIFCIYKFITCIKNNKKIKKQQKDNLKQKNATLYTIIPHLMGLPIPENSLVTIYSCKDSYEFISNGATFSLKKEKITDVSITTDTEIQKQCVSSAGGAIGGAMLFGPLGALIGGRTKTKEIKNTTTCLIFTYLKDEKIDFIAFDTTYNIPNALNFVKEYQIINNLKPKETKKIDL